MKNLFLPILSAFFLVTCTVKEKPIKLIVFIVADQSTPAILNKYKKLFSGGYKWLMNNGIQFSNTFHEHGYTSTGPGHYSLSSGVFPGRGGIIGNNWFDRDLRRRWYCVEDTLSVDLTDNENGHSYRHINSTTLGDWLKESYPESKVISIAGKDRSAILLGGKNPDLAIWYDKKGSYTTSSYYKSKLPIWLENYNETLDVLTYLDSTWDFFLDKDIYKKNTRKDFYKGESDWDSKNDYSPTLPISFKDMGTKSLLYNFYATPFGDRSLFDLAKLSIDQYQLGMDQFPDILYLGLSGTDGVGHEFGPHSHEQLDNYLRLDNYLGKFIEEIENKIGRGNVLYVLTSDHGIMDLPEYLNAKGFDAGRISKSKRDSVYTLALNKIQNQIGINRVFRYGNFFYYDFLINDYERSIATKILKTELVQIPGVAQIISKDEIISSKNNKINVRLKNMINIEKSPDIFVFPKKYWIWRSNTGTTHGSFYDYDAHIPFIYATGLTEGLVRVENIKSVDIAPTLAKILNIKYPKDLDGRPISVK